MVLVINLGLKSIRAILFSEDGRRLSNFALQINSRLVGERVEQNAIEWREKMYTVVKAVVDQAGAASSIRFVTVSCSASCLLALDKNAQPLCHAIMVSDKRAVAQASFIADLPEFKRLAQKDGISSSPYSQMARMLWIKENAPDTYAKTTWFVAPNDYLISILTGGIISTDPLNAEKNYWDTTAEAYPESLYEQSGLSSAALPDCKPIGSSVGVMPASVAKEFGLKCRPEVILGTYDALCSVFGTGVCSPGMVCDVSGTVTSVRMYANAPAADLYSRVFSQYFPPCDCYLVGGSNNLGGGLIEWAKQCFYSSVQNPYEVMQYEGQGGDTGNPCTRNGLIFLPNILGSRAPDWNMYARGVFFGIERHHTRKDLIRSIFESIGYSINDFLQVFRECSDLPDMVTASGGLARMPIANELKATITGLPYHIMDEFESTSLGAAIIVLCATGAYPSYRAACKEIVETKQIFLPRRQDKNYYDDMYGLYRELTNISNPVFEKRRGIVDKHTYHSVEYIENL